MDWATLQSMQELPYSPAVTREKGRRHIVALVTVFYLLLIFEGALRKWLLPSQGQLLFFVRDPVALAIYALALRHSFFPRNSLLTVGLAFGVLGFLIILCQAAGVASGISQWPILAVYGWRNYFLYIPLPFVIGEALERTDIERLVKLTLLMAIPIAALVLAQFRSPPNAPINVGFGASSTQQFHGLTVDMNHTRPMGTFTSDVGQKEFVTSALAMLLALWIVPTSRRFMKPWQLGIGTCALLTCLAVSGSRGAMVQSGIIGAAAVASVVVVGKAGSSTRAILLPLGIASIAVLLYPIVFPEGYGTFLNRWNTAAVAESGQGGIFGRALYGFVDFVGLLGDTPLPGYGLGLAGNASLTLGVTIPGFTGWAETDWARHIVDLGPVVGLAFIVFRCALTLWLGAVCAAGARRSGDALPFLLFAFVGLDVMSGQLTGNGVVNGYAWLFFGLSLAASSAHTRASAAATIAAEPAAALPRYPNLMR
jgi:hypothetical protein